MGMGMAHNMLMSGFRLADFDIDFSFPSVLKEAGRYSAAYPIDTTHTFCQAQPR